MKFTISREMFLEELQVLQGIVEKRNTMPILANILIEVNDNQVELTGTDLEVGLKTRIEAIVEKPGGITVNGKKIFEVVRSVKEGQDVVAEAREDKLIIRSGEAEFKLNCQPKDDFPQVQESGFEHQLSFPIDVFKEMIDRVYYAITQEQRYYLNGALLCLKNGSIELVSTDGHRLAYARSGLEELKVEKELSYIVAKKTLNEVRKFEGDKLEFDFDENNLFFRVGRRIIICRIIDSKFPNYQAVIPKDNHNQLMVSRSELADSLRRVSLLTVERSKGVKLNIEKEKIKLFSSNPEIGEAKDQITADYKGDNLEIGFNAQYLLDFLTAGATENVVLEIKDENSAVLIRPAEKEAPENIYVLMPMKI